MRRPPTSRSLSRADARRCGSAFAVSWTEPSSATSKTVPVGRYGHGDPNQRRIAACGHVLQGLLEDAEERQLDLGGQPLLPLEPDLHREACARGERRSEMLHRRGQAEVVECPRAQVDRELADALERLLDQRPELRTARVALLGRGRALDPAERHQRGRERLRCVVVELHREPLALELLGGDELAQRDALVGDPAAEEPDRNDDRRPDDERHEGPVAPTAHQPEDERSAERDDRTVPRAERDGHRPGDGRHDRGGHADHEGGIRPAECGDERGLGEQRKPHGQRTVPPQKWNHLSIRLMMGSRRTAVIRENADSCAAYDEISIRFDSSQ